MSSNLPLSMKNIMFTTDSRHLIVIHFFKCYFLSMDFTTSINTCLVKKYADFSGRASRDEFWLFMVPVYLLFSVASTHKSSFPGFEIVPIELFRAASHTESTQSEQCDRVIVP